MAVIVILIAGMATLKSNSPKDVFTENLNALTAGEGIPVNTCYIEYPFGGGSSEWALKCDSQTSTTMIYDCPTSKTYMRKSAASMCHDVH